MSLGPWVIGQAGKIRDAYPDAHPMVVLANHGNNTFDVARPGWEEGRQLTAITNINPDLVGQIGVNDTVLVGYYNGNPQQAAILSKAGFFAVPGDGTAGEADFFWTGFPVRNVGARFIHPVAGLLPGGSDFSSRSSLVNTLSTFSSVLGLVAYATDTGLGAPLGIVGVWVDDVGAVKLTQFDGDGNTDWNLTLGSGYDIFLSTELRFVNSASVILVIPPEDPDVGPRRIYAVSTLGALLEETEIATWDAGNEFDSQGHKFLVVDRSPVYLIKDWILSGSVNPAMTDQVLLAGYTLVAGVLAQAWTKDPTTWATVAPNGTVDIIRAGSYAPTSNLVMSLYEEKNSIRIGQATLRRLGAVAYRPEDAEKIWQTQLAEVTTSSWSADAATLDAAETAAASLISTFKFKTSDSAGLPGSTTYVRLPPEEQYEVGEYPGRAGSGIPARYDPDYDTTTTTWARRPLSREDGSFWSLEPGYDYGGSEEMDALEPPAGGTTTVPHYVTVGNADTGVGSPSAGGGAVFSRNVSSQDAHPELDAAGNLYGSRSNTITALTQHVEGDADDTGYHVLKRWLGTKNTTIATSPHVQADTAVDYQSAPPGSPSLLDTYIVKPPGTGDWADLDNCFVEWDTSEWIPQTPMQRALTTHSRDDGRFETESRKTPFWVNLTGPAEHIFWNPRAGEWQEGRSASEPLAKDPDDFEYVLIPNLETVSTAAGCVLFSLTPQGALRWSQTLTGPTNLEVRGIFPTPDILFVLVWDNTAGGVHHAVEARLSSNGELLWRHRIAGVIASYDFVELRQKLVGYDSSSNPYLYFVFEGSSQYQVTRILTSEDGAGRNGAVLGIVSSYEAASDDPRRGPHVFDEVGGDLYYGSEVDVRKMEQA